MKSRFSLPLLAGALVAGLVLWQQGDRSSSGLSTPAGVAVAQESSAEANADTTQEAITVTEMVEGAQDAPIKITEYASFTCPHCAHFHEDAYKNLKRDYIDTGKVRFTFRDVYFDKFGLWASLLARCEGPDRFFGLSGMLFDKQSEWLSAKSEQGIADNLRKLGKVAGMSEEKINSCLNDTPKAKALVAWYQKNATADAITGTPTLIIDGEKHSNLSYNDLKAILDKKLGE